MVLSCIDTVVVIPSDWRDTGDGTIENLTNLPPAAGYMYVIEGYRFGAPKLLV